MSDNKSATNQLKEPTVVYLGLGSNIGDRHQAFRRALEGIAALPETKIRRLSPRYYTDPVAVGGGEFLNGVVEIATTLTPEDLWRSVEQIEREIGRQHKGRSQPRVIDIDILLHGTEIVEENHLRIPHARMTERAFVLQPLADLAPDFIVPGTNQTIKALRDSLEGPHGVRPAPVARGAADLSNMV